MAKKTRKKASKDVATLTHDEAKPANIPTRKEVRGTSQVWRMPPQFLIVRSCEEAFQRKLHLW